MNLKQVGSNMTELKIKGNLILVSYETPVAAQLSSGLYIKTSKRWSSTTSKHINKWLDGADASTVSQDFLDALLSEVK